MISVSVSSDTLNFFPATGTRMWGQSRFGVFTKSPATGGFRESYCGGTLAPKIKGCGFDFLIIKEKGDSLTWLAITENSVEFNDAGPIKGGETDKAETHRLKHSPKGAGALVIGPVGENLVTSERPFTKLNYRENSTATRLPEKPER